MSSSVKYDVFFSYATRDKGIASEVVDAFRQQGLAVWFDETSIDDLGSISEGIDAGLSQAKAFVTLYSLTYPTRRACQRELTWAFLGAQSRNELRERIIVVNPESTPDHIHPVELRDQKFLTFNGNALEKAKLHKAALAVRKHVDALQYPLGTVRRSNTGPAWHGMQTAGSTRFVGRMPELWRIHSLLHSSEFPFLTGQLGPGIGQICGFGGTGKSLLAEEYARRFGDAYPGGVFWLNAFGTDIAGIDFEGSGKIREMQFRAIASSLNIPERALNTLEVRGALAQYISQANQPCLWVVDDLPSGLQTESVRAWFAPHPLAKTLFTTRSREYFSFVRAVAIEGLTPEEGLELLEQNTQPVGVGELASARRIVSMLGAHPLALDVAGAALRSSRGITTFLTFENDLSRRAGEPLNWAAELTDQLPTGHTANIALTILSSVHLLTDDARDFLRLASFLASAPIEPRLVVDVFQTVYDCDQSTSEHRAALALKNCDSLSLADLNTGGNRTVHKLISRVVVSEDSETERFARLKRAAVDSFISSVGKIVEGRDFTQIPLSITHSRALLSQQPGAKDFLLMGLVARFDSQTAQYDSAREIYERAASIARQVGDDGLLLGCLTNLLGTLWQQASTDVPAVRNEAVNIALKVIADTKGHIGLFVAGKLIRMLNEQEDAANAQVLAERALELPESVLSALDPIRFDITASLGRSLAIQDRPAEAATVLERLTNLSAEVFGPSSRETLFYQFQLTRMRFEYSTEEEESEQELLDAQSLLAKCRKTLDASDILICWMLELLGVVYRDRGRLIDSKTAFEELVNIYRKVLGEDHPVTLSMLLELSITERELDDLAQARVLQVDIVSKLMHRADSNPLHRLDAQAELVTSLRELKELESAEKMALDVWNRRVRLYGEKDERTMNARDIVIAIVIDREDFSRAEPLLRDAISVRSDVFGRDDLVTQELLSQLMMVLVKLNRSKEALAVSNELLELNERMIKREPSKFRPAEQSILLGKAKVFTATKAPPQDVTDHAAQHAPEDVQSLRKLLEEVLRDTIRSKGEKDPASIAAMKELATVFLAMKEFKKARKLYEKITAFSIDLYGAHDDRSIEVCVGLVRLLRLEGADLQHIIQVEGALLSMVREKGVWDRPSLNVLSNFAATVRSAGRAHLNAALKLGQEALALSTQYLGATDQDTLIEANNLAGTYILMNNYAEARKLLEPTFAIQIEKLGSDHPETLMTGRKLDRSLGMLADVEGLKELRHRRMTRRLAVAGVEDRATAEAIYSYYLLLSEMREKGLCGEAEKESASKLLLDQCQSLLSLDDRTLDQTQLQLKKLTKKVLNPRKWLWSR